jgi:hypothetical protein
MNSPGHNLIVRTPPFLLPASDHLPPGFKAFGGNCDSPSSQNPTHSHLRFVTCGGAVLLCSRGHMGVQRHCIHEVVVLTVHIAFELFTCVIPSWVDDPPTGSFGALEL